MNYMEGVKKQQVLEKMTEIEYYPVLRDETELKKSVKIPITELASLGLPLAGVVQQAAEKAAMAGVLEGLPPLYTINMRGLSGSLAAMHDGSGFLSSVVGDAGQGIIGQAAFVPLNLGELVSASASSVNPILLVAAAVTLSVNQKLDAIQAGQQDIMDYLKNREKAKLRSCLETLADIQNAYKFNLKDKEYKLLRAQKVQDIKGEALTSIHANRNTLQGILSSGKTLHSNKEVQNKLAAIEDTLKEYQSAVYIYAFAAFLETLLCENFRSENLKSIIAKVDKHSLQYRELYVECYDFMERYMQTSIQSGAMKGVALFTKTAGETIAKVPVLRKGPVDEVLIEAGEKLQIKGETKKQKELKNLTEKQNSYIRPFIENIELIDQLYNEPKAILFDCENLYLADC